MPNRVPIDNRPAARTGHYPGTAPLLAQHALDKADRCVLCGLCLPHCPTYRKTGDENESPRGRVSLVRALASNALPASERLMAHLSQCLGCRACERVCPSNVEYGKLITAGRALVRAQQPVAWLTRILLGLTAHPHLLEAIGAVLRGYQRSGLQRLVRASRVLNLAGVKNLESLLPTLPARLPEKALHPAHGKRRGRVALFLGCVARVLDAETLTTAIRLLNRFGFDVVIPENQTCCGALHREAGILEPAEGFARQNRAVFQAAGVDTVVTVASGCGAVLADSSKDDEFMDRQGTSTAHRVRVQDINQFLAEVTLPECMKLAPLPATIAVQDPCSLRNAMRSEQSVYVLLGRIPAAHILPLAENHLCCGGAGAYPLRQSAMADLLRADKLAFLQQLQPAVLATANIGCALHLRAGLRARGLNIEIQHPLVLFERQLREIPA